MIEGSDKERRGLRPRTRVKASALSEVQQEF